MAESGPVEDFTSQKMHWLTVSRNIRFRGRPMLLNSKLLRNQYIGFGAES